MVCVFHSDIWAAAALLLFFGMPSATNCSTITTVPQPTLTPPPTCEFRTINYITDSLPQLCGKSSWSNPNATTATKSADDANTTSEGQSSSLESSGQSTATSEGPSVSQDSITLSEAASEASKPPTSTIIAEEIAADLESGELNDASFLSFEDWKKQTLEKAGQLNANIGQKKSGDKRRDSESIQNNLDSLGDEGEIDIDFGPFGSGSNGEEQSHGAETKENEDRQDLQNREGSGRQYRSKDAGKTCKERFSYASFDAGATILKTHAGAKNAKAVLIENKDSYMLSECSAENKFLIIELSEDIWIDTLVLANYEFFSSMVRSFRVSVSDKYPVKIEKWKDVGTYEARNSREIQAFLIENPQIWTRYIRVEFLTHFGNEYYCPLSLVRVHGTRMLESWREQEAIGEEDDETDSEDQGTEEHFIPEAIAEVVQEEERLNAEFKEAQEALQELIKTAEVIGQNRFKPNSSHLEGKHSTLLGLTTPWVKANLNDLFASAALNQTLDMCLIADAPVEQPAISVMIDQVAQSSPTIPDDSTISSTTSITSTPLTAGTGTSITSLLDPLASQTKETPSKSEPTQTEFATEALSSSSSPKATPDVQESISSAVPLVAPRQNATSNKNKTTGTSSASPSLPTIQESFFKAVSRRLQLLETNSTLSLKYIEEQSKILREAFSKVEKKQLQKTSTFLDVLNSTVLAELRVFRQQYDEIWQSTVISLESQREESRREILAISSRLTILADEVVFQKRMSIVQSIILLLCLGLVIFSRVSSAGQLDFQSIQTRARALGFPISPLESPLDSPKYHRTTLMGESVDWPTPEHTNSDESPLPRSPNREDSPPTPTSTYSRPGTAFTPPSGGDDLSGSGHLAVPSGHTRISLENRARHPLFEQWQDGDDDETDSSSLLSSSPARTPQRRKDDMRQPTRSPDSIQGEGLEEPLHDESGSRDLTWEESNSVSQRSTISPPPLQNELSGFGPARKPLPPLPTNLEP